VTDDNNNNGWSEHKKLVEYRLNKNDADHCILGEKLDQISMTLTAMRHEHTEQLTELKVEHRLGKYFVTTVVATVVSLIVSAVGWLASRVS